jgi:S-DNA-T family DNA segregation ATPase FtsK/SpoIIIE
MQLAFTVRDFRGGAHVDVLVRADAHTRIGALAAALEAAVRPSRRGRAPARAGPSLTLAGQAIPLEPSLPLVRSPLCEGVVVLLDAPPVRRASGAGLVDLVVTAGPGAGVIHPLPAGEHLVGTAPGSAVLLSGPAATTPLLTVRVVVDGTCQVVPGPGARVVLPRPPVADGTVVASVYSSTVTLRLERPAPAAPPPLPSAAVPGRLEVNPPPRLRPAREASAFRLPAPPAPPRHTPVPVLVTLLPLLAAAGMAVVLGSASLLLFAVLGPVSLVASVVSARRRDRRAFRAERERHQQIRTDVERAAGAALRAEHDERHADHPDPAELIASAWQRDARLWRRRRGDADYLRLRVGTATQPSTIEVSAAAPGDPSTRLSADVPAVISLAEHGVIGVAAPGADARALGYWLVVQAAILHSPRQLVICVLVADPRRAAAWRWIRWLPHCRREAADAATVWFAAGAASRAACVAELRAMIEGRRDLPPQRAGHDVLVVLDGARALRSSPGMTMVLRSGPAVGVHTVCLDTDVRDLPAECRTVVEPDGRHLTVRQDHGMTIRNVEPDLVGPTGGRRSPSGLLGTARWCESVARALAPLRDPGGDDGALPTTVPLSEIIHLHRPVATAIRRRWASARRAGAAAAGRPVPVGIAGGGTFALSLAGDGPHGLIAGTTGSGKSELLQTIIVAHAVTYRPDELVFVLVDYKGGSAFAECAALPHTVGLVTDLDPHLVRRALTSLSAELRRREALLARSQAKDLEALGQAGRGPVPPRLVLVVDEFATLARELPDFVAGLVGLAQRGRSLGLHLLLATQRPSGVVSPEIRANTNLRIALRVTDAAESEDVVGRPDAALIGAATPGRAVVRAGPDRVTVVQTGWVGGPARRAAGDGSSESSTPEVVPLPWPDRTDAESTGGHGGPSVGSATRDTELTVLVHGVREAADALRIPDQPSPWLPPLPDRIPVLPPRSRPATTGHSIDLGAVPVGLSDHCDLQLQRPFTFDVEDGGHLLVVGGPRSGRSTVLRTVAGAIAAALSPRDVHIYGLDCGGDALGALTALPHTGALVSRNEVDRVVRLLARLTATVEQRRRRFAADGVADLREARRSDGAVSPPYMVLLLDGFEGFLAEFEDLDGGDLVESLLRLLREGPAAGLRVVLSADRRGLIGRLASLVDERLVLRMADPGDYALAGIGAADMPERLPAGRGVVIGGRFPAPVEVQVGLLDAEPTGRAQTAALRAVGSHAASRVAAAGPQQDDRRPFRVEPLPDRVGRARMAAALRARTAAPHHRAPRPGLRVALGLGGDDLDVVEIDLADDPGFVIGGPPRAGRSSALLTVAMSLLAAGETLVAVTPRPSALRTLVDHPGVVALLDADLNSLVGPTGRADPYGADPPEPSAGIPWPEPTGGPQWFEPRAGRRPSVVLVDDAELVGEPAATALANHWRRARDAGGALVLAGLTEELLLQYRGFAVDVRREGHGLLLGPRRATDGDLLGVRLPRGGAGPLPPGRGFVVRRGSVVPVQVVCPSDPPSRCSTGPSPRREPHENGHDPGGHAGRRPDESAAARPAEDRHESRQPRQHAGGPAPLGGPEGTDLPWPDLAGGAARTHRSARRPHGARPGHRRDQQADRGGGELITAPPPAPPAGPTPQPRQGAHHDPV